jgi:hypothetical protein
MVRLKFFTVPTGKIIFIGKFLNTTAKKTRGKMMEKEKNL